MNVINVKLNFLKMVISLDTDEEFMKVSNTLAKHVIRNIQINRN